MKKPRKKGSGGPRPGYAGAKKKEYAKVNRTYRIDPRILEKIKQMGIMDIGNKVNNFLQDLILNEKITRLQVTSDKIEALKDIIDACYSIEVPMYGVLSNQIDLSLYMRICEFTTSNLSSRDPKSEEQMKTLYMDAIMAFNEFLDSNQKAPRQLFSDIHNELYLEFVSLMNEI